MRFDQANAECCIFTFKEGLLSAVAHDLQLRVGRFVVELDGHRVEARFDAASLEVVCVMRDGKEAPGVLSARDCRSIERDATRVVLQAQRHPEILYRAEARGDALDGTLTLHGRSRPVRAALSQSGGRRIARARLHQPDFGIRPYSALLGTLRVQPDLEVEVRLPAATSPDPAPG